MEKRERESMAEVAKLKEALERDDNRIVVLEAESSELQAEKEAVEIDLDKTRYFGDVGPKLRSGSPPGPPSLQQSPTVR